MIVEGTLSAIIVIVVVVAVIFWILDQITFSPRFAMLKWIIMVVVGAIAILKLLTYL